MTLKKALSIIVIFAAGFLALGCILPPAADLFHYLTAGWAMFLWRVIPETSLSRDGVLTAAFCLVGLSAGLHYFLGWLYREMYCQPGKPEDAGDVGSPARGSADQTLRRWPVRWTGMLLGLLVLMFIAGLSAVGITHQTTWLVRSPESLVDGNSIASRIRSVNKLREIAIAAHNYHDTYGNFPAGGMFDAQGRALHGWQTLLLPYVERKDLFQQINHGIPWPTRSTRRISEPRSTSIYRRTAVCRWKIADSPSATMQETPGCLAETCRGQSSRSRTVRRTRS